ncbi:hypothetical protein ACHAPT_005553 [Fusarium lateritium]
MELREYDGRRYEYSAAQSPPTDWQPSSPSIARKPVGAMRETPPLGSPDYPSQSFSSRVAQGPYFPRQIDPNVDTTYHGSPTPLGIWEPTQPAPQVGPGQQQQQQQQPMRPQQYRYDSEASLLSPYRFEGVPRQSPPDPPQAPPQSRRRRCFNWWLTEWKPSWSMYVLVASGIAFAMGHHFFYKGLHGQLAKDQQGMFRYGAALAFLSKACFLNAVVLAFRQRVLMMIRRKMLSLATLDSLFAASEDLTALLNWEAWVNAKFAMGLTIFIWTSPLIVILASYTLTVMPLKVEEVTKCPEIRTLNFSHEQFPNWWKPIREDGLIELSVSRWNTTAKGPNVGPDDPEGFDYWTEASQQLRLIALKSMYTQQAVMRKKAPAEICGRGWNCSYTIEFEGPGYRCQPLASGVGATVKKLGDAECPFSTDDLLPRGNFSYIADLYQGDYESPQIDSGDGGRPNMKRPYPKNLGALRTEPILWFGYADVEDRSKPQPENRDDKHWDTAFTPTVFGCEHYHTKYTVQFNHSGDAQVHKIKKREFLRKVIDTTYLPDEKDPNKKLKDRIKAVPEENYIMPQDVSLYRQKMAYHAIGSLLREFVNGTIKMPFHIAETMAIETRLIERLNYLPIQNFPEEVQKFYEEILISFFSDPQFIVVSWANDPKQWSGSRIGGDKTGFDCTRFQLRNCYFYNYAQLWAVYAISMGITIVAVASGVAAMEEDSLMHSLSFSAILAATRGSSLDKLRWEKGAEIKNSKIGFGVVEGQAGERAYSFGVEGDVRQEKAMSTARSPAISVMDWGDRAARRMSYAVLNRRDRE